MITREFRVLTPLPCRELLKCILICKALRALTPHPCRGLARSALRASGCAGFLSLLSQSNDSLPVEGAGNRIGVFYSGSIVYSVIYHSGTSVSVEARGKRSRSI